MVIKQVALEIPDNIYQKLSTGEYKIVGGTVRKRSGEIVTLLNDAKKPAQNNEPGKLSITEVLKKNKVAIAIGLGVVAVGGVVLSIAKKNRKNKQNSAPEMPKFIKNYNASMCVYLEAIRNGNVDIGTINSLITALNDIKEYYNDGKITIDFSTEQLNTLVNLVFNYTRKLAEANSVEINELKEPVSIVDSTINDLQRYLEVQKQIFEKE